MQVLYRQQPLHPTVSPLRRSLPLIVMSLDIHPFLIAHLTAVPHRLPRTSTWGVRSLPVLRLLSCDPRPAKLLREWAPDRQSLSNLPHRLPLPI